MTEKKCYCTLSSLGIDFNITDPLLPIAAASGLSTVHIRCH